MTRFIPLIVLAAGLAAVITFVQQRSARTRGGFQAYDFTLPDLDGNTVRLSEHHGKIVFLNLWATWCPPCREEMPAMERLYQRFRHKDFVILAVSEDTDSTAVRNFVQSMRLSFPVLLDPQGALPGRYGITGYPETFIIDRNGQVIQHIIGPENWDSEKSIRYFSELLEKPHSAEAERAAR